MWKAFVSSAVRQIVGFNVSGRVYKSLFLVVSVLAAPTVFSGGGVKYATTNLIANNSFEVPRVAVDAQGSKTIHEGQEVIRDWQVLGRMDVLRTGMPKAADGEQFLQFPATPAYLKEHKGSAIAQRLGLSSGIRKYELSFCYRSKEKDPAVSPGVIVSLGTQLRETDAVLTKRVVVKKLELPISACDADWRRCIVWFEYEPSSEEVYLSFQNLRKDNFGLLIDDVSLREVER